MAMSRDANFVKELFGKIDTAWDPQLILSFIKKMQKEIAILSKRDPGVIALGAAVAMTESPNTVKLVKALLDLKADVNEAVSYQKSFHFPLIAAARNGSEKTINLLLDPKVNVKINMKQGAEGINALMSATVMKYPKIVTKLLDAKANVNAKSNIGNPAIIYSSDAQITKILLERKADVNSQNNDKTTSLICAVYRDQKEVVQTLLDFRADVNLKNNKGFTALQYSSCAKHLKKKNAVAIYGLLNAENKGSQSITQKESSQVSRPLKRLKS